MRRRGLFPCGLHPCGLNHVASFIFNFIVSFLVSAHIRDIYCIARRRILNPACVDMNPISRMPVPLQQCAWSTACPFCYNKLPGMTRAGESTVSWLQWNRHWPFQDMYEKVEQIRDAATVDHREAFAPRSTEPKLVARGCVGARERSLMCASTPFHERERMRMSAGA